MRLGITIPLDGFQNRNLIDLVRHAEKLGFEDAWSFETMQGDGVTPIAAAATVTERIRLGTAILPVFTRSPALLALSAANLQQFSGGRFILGLGISTPTIVQQWMNVPYEKPITRLRETVEALRAIFSGQKVSMKGTTIQFDGFRLGVPLDTPPPIFIGAQGELMLRTAGELGDGTIVNFITPEAFPQMLAHIREGARKARKPTTGIEVACRILVAVDQEEEVVRDQLRRELTGYLTVPQYNKFFQWIGYENEARTAITAWNAGDRKRALASVPDYMLESIFVFGTPERWARRLKDYDKAGITATALQFVSYAASPEEKRTRILRAMEALATAW